MADTDLPSIDYLRQRLRYEPETGKLYWRDDAAMHNRWRWRYANTEAFTSSNGNGYRMGRINYRGFLAHRVAWAIVRGAWPGGQIDHIDHDRANNRIENLRVVAHQENHRNTTRRKNNTSGVVGVSWYKAGAKWTAYIMVDRTKQHLGYFDNIDDAIAARKAAEAEYGFHANHGVEAARPAMKD